MQIDFEQHMNHLHCFALKLMKNHHNAEDLVQLTCLKALENLHQFDGKNALGWLRRIMFNLMISDYRRKKSVQFVGIGPDTLANMISAGELMDLEISDEIVDGLGELDERYRSVLLLAAEDYSYKEIARKLKKPVGTVMSRLSRARKFMQNELRPAA